MLSLFPDNVYDPNQGTVYEFYKKSVEKQLRIRHLIKEIVKETNKYAVGTSMRNMQRESILDFVRPYNRRQDFDMDSWGLDQSLTFELYVYFRSFYNPDLKGFLSVNLHQYHILFQLLEHEMTFTETEVQGIYLKFVLFSSTTSSNMAKFLRQMHSLDIIPLLHPNGYRQVLF